MAGAGMALPRGVDAAQWAAMRDATRADARDARARGVAQGWRDADEGLIRLVRDGAADPQAALTRVADRVTARDWLARRIADALTPTRDDPWFVPPLRTHHGGGQRGVVLFESGPVTVTLLVLPPPRAGAPPPATVVFAHGLMLTHVVKSGGAGVQRYRVERCARDPDGLTAATAGRCVAGPVEPLCDGARLFLDQSCDSYRLCDARRDTVIVQCLWRDAPSLPMREYDVATGRLHRMASADRTASFATMALTLLRTMERRDAVPAFVATLSHSDFAVRWNAMRELLALDPIAAAPHLARLAAADPHPDVRASAQATQRMLIERNLVPAPPEPQPCPA